MPEHDRIPPEIDPANLDVSRRNRDGVVIEMPQSEDLELPIQTQVYVFLALIKEILDRENRTFFPNLMNPNISDEKKLEWTRNQHKMDVLEYQGRLMIEISDHMNLDLEGNRDSLQTISADKQLHEKHILVSLEAENLQAFEDIKTIVHASFSPKKVLAIATKSTKEVGPKVPTLSDNNRLVLFKRDRFKASTGNEFNFELTMTLPFFSWIDKRLGDLDFGAVLHIDFECFDPLSPSQPEMNEYIATITGLPVDVLTDDRNVM